MANESVTTAAGFVAAGVACGIKRSGKADLGLISCPEGAVGAAVFTTNKIVSAAVTVCREHARKGKVYGVVMNSGNANACTGQKGVEDAVSMCRKAGELLGTAPGGILVASTGIIGHPLPVDKVRVGIDKAVKKLSASKWAGNAFARAIMTTDTRCKQAMRKVRISGREVIIGGTAKGAGMIGPNMATTISVVTTDIAISKGLLKRALKDAVGQSLNKLTVDGYQSTNDTAILLASGAAGNRAVVSVCPRYRAFFKALQDLYTDLAVQMALDAEGATRMFKVVVNGAASKAEAEKAARAVADYDLVKCAIHGEDPNWGRIICAVGSCGVRLNPEKLGCKIGDISVFRGGKPTKFDAGKASRQIRSPKHVITIELGAGKSSDFCYGCDLSAGYVRINADYHT